jgi:hypothetical protein
MCQQSSLPVCGFATYRSEIAMMLLLQGVSTCSYLPTADVGSVQDEQQRCCTHRCCRALCQGYMHKTKASLLQVPCTVTARLTEATALFFAQIMHMLIASGACRAAADMCC